MAGQPTRKRRIVTRAAIALVAAALCVLLFKFVAVPQITSFAAATHQRSVTRSLAEWANDYGKPQNDDEATRAVDMLEYIPTYYPLQDGYRSDSETEAALERQRVETISAIIVGLRDFSGQDFGSNASKWRQWLDSHDRVK